MNRKCHRCRLNRCFAMGMRKDFIVKKEEKKTKKKRLKENGNVPSRRSLNSDSLPQTLDETDHVSFTF
jgi:hypothetical protein